MWRVIKGHHIATIFLGLILLVICMADFLANDRPILSITSSGKWAWFTAIEADQSYSRVIHPLVHYKGGLDLGRTMLPPFTQTEGGHYLGTDHLGRDVLAGIIHGARMSLGIGLSSILIAAFIGIMLGGLAGYYGDRGITLNISQFLLFLLLTVAFYYYLIHLNLAILPFVIIAALASIVHLKWLSKSKWGARLIELPVDLLTVKFMEVFSSIPGYFLVMSIIIFVEPGWFVFALIVGATRWVDLARLVRGEVIKVRASGYIESAKALGVSQSNIFFKHALPNSLSPLPYALTFGIAGVIVIESTLSFLGVGLPADSMSWGNLLSGFKNNTSAWWIALIPGSFIFLTICCLHVIGRRLDEEFNPRSGQS